MRANRDPKKLEKLLYILDPTGEKPVPCNDPARWSDWWKENGSLRRVKLTIHKNRKLAISTVFLGVDHSFMDEAPLLWETMVFSGGNGEDYERCGGTREQALAMHQNMIERVEAVLALGELESV